MRLNRVPTGQLTSASASLTKPCGPFMPRPDANKENQSKHTQTHFQTDFVFMTTPWKTQELQDKLQDCATDKYVTQTTGWISYYTVGSEEENKWSLEKNEWQQIYLSLTWLFFFDNIMTTHLQRSAYIKSSCNQLMLLLQNHIHHFSIQFISTYLCTK